AYGEASRTIARNSGPSFETRRDAALLRMRFSRALPRITPSPGEAIVVARHAGRGRRRTARGCPERQYDAHGLVVRRSLRASDCLTFIEPYDLCDRHGGLLSPCPLVACNGWRFGDSHHVSAILACIAHSLIPATQRSA